MVGIKPIKETISGNVCYQRMQVTDEVTSDEKQKFWFLAEPKLKRFKKHSMNIDGREKLSNWWSLFTLGKARYYDQRFVPALDAFNYILYKYPNSSRIYEAKMAWKKPICDWEMMLCLKKHEQSLNEQNLKKKFCWCLYLLSEFELEEKTPFNKIKIA
jgi:hypothetical protein